MEAAVGVDGRRLLVMAAPRRDICFDSDDRLDPGFGRLLVEFDRAEHVAMVGDRQRGHFEIFGELDDRIKSAGAIQQRILAMRM